MDVQYGPIPIEPDYLQSLRALVHPADELLKAGYVLDQISSSDLDRKRRCERCCRALIKWDKGKRPGPPTLAPASDPTSTSTSTSAGHAAVQETRNSDGHDTRPGERPAEPFLRCRFHPGRVAYKKWTCCNGHVLSKPCTGEQGHCARQYGPGQLEDNWRFYATPPAAPPSHPAAVVVIDCEMGTAASGESELIRLSIVDFFSRDVLLDSLVWPAVEMAHYNTRFSGITRQMMDDARRRRTCIFGRDNARRAAWRLVGPETVLVGHAAQQDLTCLRWIHPLVVDTLLIETRRRRDVKEAEESSQPAGGLSLKTLALRRLNRVIQVNARGHDSVEDAIATRDVLHWHVIQQHFEGSAQASAEMLQ